MKVTMDGFSSKLLNALYDQEGYLFFLEVVGLSEVNAICAGAISGRGLTLENEGSKVEVSIFRYGLKDPSDESRTLIKCLIKWKWKQKSLGPVQHAVLFPEETNAYLENAPWPRPVIGRDEREALDALWRFLNLTLDVPIPEGRDLRFLRDLLETAKAESKEEVLSAIEPLSGLGNVKGFLVKNPSLLEDLLKKFYSFLIKKKEIRLEGKEVELEKDTLEAFLDRWGTPLTRKVIDTYKPLYKIGEGLPPIDEAVAGLRRKPFAAQREAVNALWKAFFEHGRRRAVLCGEQGTGKTFMALALIGTAPRPMRVLVVCPPHLVPKWAREVRETIPGVKTVTLNGKDALKKLAALKQFLHGRPENHEIWIVGRERLKLSCPWKPAVIPATHTRKGSVALLPGKKAEPGFPLYACPNCGRIIYRNQKDDREDVVPADWKWLSRARRTCDECGSPLWEPDSSRLRRYAPADFIKKNLRGFFDFLVVDECHEYKAQSSAQANAVGSLISVCDRALFLTGTLAGGYASDIYFLYFRAFPEEFRRDGWDWSSGTQFLKRYGILEEVEVIKEEEDNFQSRGKKSRKVYLKKRPGVSPEVLARFLLPHTVFVRLEDMASELPPYEEFYVAVERGDEDAGEYERCHLAYEEKANSCRNTKARLALASKFVSVLMNLPDCVRHLENEIWRDVKDDEGNVVERVLLHKTEIVPGGPLAKERWLAGLIRSEKRAGRKVLVYCTYTGEKDITSRLAEVLISDFGLQVKVLPSSVPTDKREDWIRKNAPFADALVCNPKLVETGLDLFDFPTVVFYQPGYRVYTLRQAARRSWRLGQKKPVRVYFLAAEGTVQEDAWSLIAQKWNVSLAIEGELVTEGFATEFDSGGSIIGELAKKLASGRLGDVSAEKAFRKLKEREVKAQSFVGELPERPTPELRVETKAKEIRPAPRPRTLVISVARKKGSRTKWVRMEIKPEELERVKKEVGGPIQLGLF